MLSNDAELREEALALSSEDIGNLSRDEIKDYLRVLGVPYDNKDNTTRLSRLLQVTIEKTNSVDGFEDVARTPTVKRKETTASVASDPMLTMLQILQHQMKSQEERFMREQERRDREQERRDREQERRDQELTAILERVSSRTDLRDDPTQGEDSSRRGEATRISIRPPELLEDGTTLKMFKRWEASWTNYAQVAKLGEKTREDQIATFWTFCTPEFLQRIRHAMEIPMNTQLTLSGILEKIKAHLKSQRNIAVDRYKLVYFFIIIIF